MLQNIYACDNLSRTNFITKLLLKPAAGLTVRPGQSLCPAGFFSNSKEAPAGALTLGWTHHCVCERERAGWIGVTWNVKGYHAGVNLTTEIFILWINFHLKLTAVLSDVADNREEIGFIGIQREEENLQSAEVQSRRPSSHPIRLI